MGNTSLATSNQTSAISSTSTTPTTAGPSGGGFSWAAMATKKNPDDKFADKKAKNSPSMASAAAVGRKSYSGTGGFKDGYRDRERGGYGHGRVDEKRYPDNMQIFVGNLPQEIEKVDLEKHFKTAGPICEIRLNPTQKKPPSRDSPAFAFVVFENTADAHKVLNSKKDWVNFMFRGSSVRINVEPKEPKDEGRRGERRSITSFNSNISSSTHSLNSVSSIDKSKGARRNTNYRY